MSRYALVACLMLVGCGGDDEIVDPQTAGSGGAGGGAPQAGALLPCPPGELELDDGSCVAPGVPADGCGVGFVSDNDGGCVATLPARACPEGQMAIPGETMCAPPAPCTGSPWGAAPVETETQFVDASYTGGNSDGSASMPWTTVQAGIDAAVSGAVVASRSLRGSTPRTW
jgi:hypothetical protein